MVLRSLCLCFLILITVDASAQRTENISVKVAGGSLAGTLTLPDGRAIPPVALILSSSGDVDRDGNTSMFSNNMLKLLADSLAKHGIASIRYDKRGTGAGKQLAEETTLRFPQYAADASAWLRWIRTQKRFSKTVVVGHGEGALVGMMAAKRTKPDAFVGIGTPAEPSDTVLLRQFRDPEVKNGVRDTARSLFLELRRTGKIAAVPRGNKYMSIFRPSIQPFLLSWIKVDPKTEIKNLVCPVLLIQGDNDFQNDSSQIRILSTVMPGADTAVIPGMNYVLRQAPRELVANMNTYFEADRPLDATLISEIVSFVGRK